MPREEGEQSGDVDTGDVTNRLLKTYPTKRWVVDGGALQEMDASLLKENMIITPHQGEFQKLFNLVPSSENAQKMSKQYGCTILLKGQTDTVCSPADCVLVRGGNPGMTKGGTGDVLAGLVAALYCKNDAYLSAKVASFVNKKAGDKLSEKVGVNFNSADLVNQVPLTLKEITS
jgi:NAD(P)H-hydrate epimerase